MRRSVLCVCIFAICAALRADPSLDLETVVHRLYDRYAASDIDGAMALWSPTAADAAAFRARLAGTLRVRCVEVRDVAVSRVAIDGDRATADVAVDLLKWGRSTFVSHQETELATLTFARDGGGWLLSGWKRQEEALADALVAAKSLDERRKILAVERRLITPALEGILDRRATQFVNEQRLRDASGLSWLIEDIAFEIGDLSGLALARGLDSIILRRQQQWDLAESVRAARESVLFAEQSGYSEVLARSLLRLGRAERSNNTNSLGKPSFLRALDLLDDVEDSSGVAMAVGGLAEYYDNLGDHRAALHYALLSRDLAVAGNDPVAELNAGLHIAGAYQIQGDYALALPYLQRAITLSHATRVTGSVPAEASYDAALCHLELGDEKAFVRAIAEGAAELGQTAKDTTALGRSLLAEYHLKHGNLRRAATEAEEALRMAETGFRPIILDRVLLTLSAVRLRQGRAREALTLARKVENGPYRLLLVARANRELGRRADAYHDLRASLRAADDDLGINYSAADERQRELRFEQYVAPFVELADMLVEDRRFAEALEISERAKGRELLDVIRGGRRLARGMMNAAEREREREIEERVASLNARLQATPSRDAASESALSSARLELQEYRVILFQKYPRLKAQQGDVPIVTRAQLAELLPQRSAAFLEYVIEDRRTLAFLVRRNGSDVSVRCRTIAISRKRLATKVADLVNAVAGRDRLYAAPSKELYRLLIAPFGTELHGVETLCIIPDGPLWQLPFESLLMPDDRFLIETTAVFYAPSITVYREMVRRERSSHAAGTFLAFADPPVPAQKGSVSSAKLRDGELAPLPDAAREVESIATFYSDARSKVYVGTQALESRVKAESPGYSVIHFATHGTLDDHDPMFSHLVLAARPGDPSEDGLLETWEMMQLDLHANLAVLSACETARGRVHAGEGLIGMSWALFVAGTSSTIATQWKIDSATAADLMIDFYRQWLGARPGTSFAKAKALRRAQMRVLSDPAHHHPFYWSAFVLVGAGG
jgi:CHAT domain-containing protein/tetratricopeptide (TPR) repeat protein